MTQQLVLTAASNFILTYSALQRLFLLCPQVFPPQHLNDCHIVILFFFSHSLVVFAERKVEDLFCSADWCGESQ